MESLHEEESRGEQYQEIMGVPNLVGPRLGCGADVGDLSLYFLHEPQGGYIGKSHRRTVPGTQ